MKKLTKLEQETIILWNDAEELATVIHATQGLKGSCQKVPFQIRKMKMIIP